MPICLMIFNCGILEVLLKQFLTGKQHDNINLINKVTYLFTTI